MSSPTGQRHDPTTAVRRRLGAIVTAGAVVTLGLVALSGPARAASVAGLPFAGPTSCGQLATRFGGGPYTEIRFSTLPAVGATKTASRAGLTVTVARQSATTMSWHASEGIDLVFVNAGRAPGGSDAVYRYQPEATADTGLRGTNPSDVLDHVVVCFDRTPKKPTTTTAATTVPGHSTTSTEMVPIVSCAYPPTCQIARTTTTTTAYEQQVTTTAATTTVEPAATTTAVPLLPATGGGPDRLATAGVALLALGLGTLVLAGWRRSTAVALDDESD